MEKYYKKSLANIHDKYYGDLASNATFHLLNYIKDLKLLNINKVIDLGCGSGILASILSNQGFNVIGGDISSEMIKIAKEKVPNATFIESSIFDYIFPKTDIITSIGEPFNYLFDNKNSYEEINKLFKKIYESLTISGVFLFDILTNNAYLNPTPKIISKDNVDMFIEASVDSLSSILTRKITIFSKCEDYYTKDIEIHQQYLFEEEKIIQLLESIGFKVIKLDNYNGVNFRQGHVGFLCTNMNLID